MKEKETISIGKFSFDVPENWEHEFDDGIITIYDDVDGEGAIQISNFDTPEDYMFNVFNEFYDFISENIVVQKSNYNLYKKIKTIRDNFLAIELTKDDRFLILSMYYCEHSVLFVNYNCELDNLNKEKSIVQNFLLAIKTENS